MAKRTTRAEEASIQRMMHAARRISGELDRADEPLSDDEIAIMAEVRAAYRRPTSEEIKQIVKEAAAKRRRNTPQ